MPFRSSSYHKGYQTCQQSFSKRLPLEADANSLPRVVVREKRHGDVHKVPVVLRVYELDQFPDLKPAALITLDLLNHPRHKFAVSDLAHIVERLPCGRLKVLGVDGHRIVFHDVRDTTHRKLLRERFLFMHVDRSELRSICPGFRDSKSLGRLDSRRLVAVCES